MDLPVNRFINQSYIFFLLESPYHTGISEDSLPDNFFNVTLTYRLDSDILFPYGVWRKLDEFTPANQKWNWDEVKEMVNNKTGLILYLVSNCHTPSKREAYVENLNQFIAITQYGNCNNMACDEECANKLRMSHRFYLAFENSVCRDYVTEKVFRNMKELLVPVVLKNSIYANILPDASYIAADDFNSPRELALYLKYFEWTKYYQKSTSINYSCALCKYLHEHSNHNTSKTISDIRSWWFEEGQCIDDYAWQLLHKTEITTT
ncbi:unnamed protein product [Thelazia callipaeda]|uniref:Fucosyltransferase n=1 Tax=Thelazia callipaeda TaxID=103827 RepID=A0A0N5CS57_THECL|nr:unnamed protein product [Thelazia callipaeda]